MPSKVSNCGKCQGPARKCKACSVVRAKAWASKNPERYKEIQRQARARRRKSQPEAVYEANRKAYMKAQHNLTLAQWDMMFKKQGGKCAICGKLWESHQRKYHVDHDHKTGLIRGLLCWSCNLKLDERVTPEWLDRAAKYLRNPPAVQALGEKVYGRKGRVGSRRGKKG